MKSRCKNRPNKAKNSVKIKKGVHPTMKKYILTIGLNDKDTYVQKYDTITAYKIVENILSTYTDGYTIYETTGGYKHDDGTFITEKSLRVELLFISETLVRIIANKIKSPTALNQETIVLEIQEYNSELI